MIQQTHVYVGTTSMWGRPQWTFARNGPFFNPLLLTAGVRIWPNPLPLADVRI